MYIQIFHLYTILNVQSSKPISSSLSLRKHISILTAPSTWLLYWGAFNLKIRFLWTTRSSRSHSLLYFLSHGHEGLLHICGVFGTCFKKGNAKRVSKLLQAENMVFEKMYGLYVSTDLQRKFFSYLRRCVVHHFFCSEITLISYK